MSSKLTVGLDSITFALDKHEVEKEAADTILFGARMLYEEGGRLEEQVVRLATLCANNGIDFGQFCGCQGWDGTGCWCSADKLKGK